MNPSFVVTFLRGTEIAEASVVADSYSSEVYPQVTFYVHIDEKYVPVATYFNVISVAKTPLVK